MGYSAWADGALKVSLESEHVGLSISHGVTGIRRLNVERMCHARQRVWDYGVTGRDTY